MLVTKTLKLIFHQMKIFNVASLEKYMEKLGSDVHYGYEDNIGICHIYSLPYQFECFFDLNNSFQGDILNTVQCLKMSDKRPFEHNLFKLISQCFPHLKELHVMNCQPQKTNRDSSVLIIFPHLILLNLIEAHVDYAEQLLYDKNTHLPSLLDLCIEYESLVIITNNFTNNTICRNCSKIKKLHPELHLRSENIAQYFPSL